MVKFYLVYYDKKGVMEFFIKNGMCCVFVLLGYNIILFEEDVWIYEVVVNEDLCCVEMYLKFMNELFFFEYNIYVR